MTAPHQDERVEAAVHAAVGFGVSQLGELSAGYLPVTPELERIAADLVETGIRHLLSLFDLTPRVDVVAGPDAIVTITIHDPGASPDVEPR